MTHSDFLPLLRITDAAFQAAQAKLQKDVTKEAELRAALKTLLQDQNTRSTNILGHADPAFLAGADVHWRTWVEQRRALINAELARCLASQTYHRELAAKAFGKIEAVKALQRQSKTAAQQKAARRADYNTS